MSLFLERFLADDDKKIYLAFMRFLDIKKLLPGVYFTAISRLGILWLTRRDVRGEAEKPSRGQTKSRSTHFAKGDFTIFFSAPSHRFVLRILIFFQCRKFDSTRTALYGVVQIVSKFSRSLARLLCTLTF